MIYNSHVFTSILSISNMPPPVVRPITSSHTAQSGTFYNFTLCSLSCFPFIFNLPVFTFCSKTITREEPHNCLYQFPPELRFCTYTSHRLTLISHHFASHCTATIPLSLLATTHLETPRFLQLKDLICDQGDIALIIKTDSMSPNTLKILSFSCILPLPS